MPTTTHQHFVPRSYLKAWENTVRNSKEPLKRFSGVYVFEDENTKGEGYNIKRILWNQSLYTIKYKDYIFIQGKYPEIDKDFICGIQNVLEETYSQKVLAKLNGKSIITKQDILGNLLHLEEWEFVYANGELAPKLKIINSINNLTSQSLEKGLGDVFERSWTNTRDCFISEVETNILSGKQHCIPENIVEDMVRFFLSMMCRNPSFDLFGIYENVRKSLLNGKDDGFTNDIIHTLWLGELYRMIYGGDSGAFKLGVTKI